MNDVIKEELVNILNQFLDDVDSPLEKRDFTKEKELAQLLLNIFNY